MLILFKAEAVEHALGKSNCSTEKAKSLVQEVQERRDTGNVKELNADRPNSTFAVRHPCRLSTIILTAVFAGPLLCVLPQTAIAQQKNEPTD